MSPKVTHLFPSPQGPPLGNLLTRAFRLAEDLEPKHARIIAQNLGGDPNFILESGYRITSSGFLTLLHRHNVEIPSFVRSCKTILLPCRDEHDEIVGLHDELGRWIFGPAAHVSHPKRATSAPIRICLTISEADSLALAQNVCTIASHGLPISHLLQELNGEFMGVAA